jgi:hypothetical protein
MTTFTLKDYVENKGMIEEQDGSVTINVEPIPFAGIVTILDSEDRIETLKHQLQIVTAECHRLRGLLNENDIKY